MKQTRYMISDTAKKVDVESHVLRYWEEELSLPISRNEMGHRYYTEDDILLFRNIKCLKDQGFALKAIKLLLPELSKRTPESLSNLFLLREELNQRAEEIDAEKETAYKPEETMSLQERTQNRHSASSETCQSKHSHHANMSSAVNAESISALPDTDALAAAEQKLLQFQEIVGQAVSYALSNSVGQLVEKQVRSTVEQALSKNNRQLVSEMSRQLSADICEDLDGLMQEREQRDEERYRNLDNAIRERQRIHKEAAVASVDKLRGGKQKKKVFQRGKKL